MARNSDSDEDAPVKKPLRRLQKIKKSPNTKGKKKDPVKEERTRGNRSKSSNRRGSRVIDDSDDDEEEEWDNKSEDDVEYDNKKKTREISKQEERTKKSKAVSSSKKKREREDDFDDDDINEPRAKRRAPGIDDQGRFSAKRLMEGVEELREYLKPRPSTDSFPTWESFQKGSFALDSDNAVELFQKLVNGELDRKPAEWQLILVETLRNSCQNKDKLVKSMFDEKGRESRSAAAIIFNSWLKNALSDAGARLKSSTNETYPMVSSQYLLAAIMNLIADCSVINTPKHLQILKTKRGIDWNQIVQDVLVLNPELRSDNNVSGAVLLAKRRLDRINGAAAGEATGAAPVESSSNGSTVATAKTSDNLDGVITKKNALTTVANRAPVSSDMNTTESKANTDNSKQPKSSLLKSLLGGECGPANTLKTAVYSTAQAGSQQAAMSNQQASERTIKNDEVVTKSEHVASSSSPSQKELEDKRREELLKLIQRMQPSSAPEEQKLTPVDGKLAGLSSSTKKRDILWVKKADTSWGTWNKNEASPPITVDWRSWPPKHITKVATGQDSKSEKTV